MPLNIGILEGGAVAEEYQHHLLTFTDAFRQFLALDERDSVLHPYACYAGAFPDGPEAHDGWLITGSAASVYDGDAWIADLEAFVRAAAETRPVVGICFGHQLVAQAFGGSVNKAHGWGVGVHDHEVRVQADWMRPTLDSISLLASHQDQVQSPPPGAEVLGGSDFCPIGLMTIGDNVMTIPKPPGTDQGVRRRTLPHPPRTPGSGHRRCGPRFPGSADGRSCRGQLDPELPKPLNLYRCAPGVPRRAEVDSAMRLAAALVVACRPP